LMKRVCLYPIKYRFHHCDYRRMLADGLWYCICSNGECRECMENFSIPKDKLSKAVLELLRQINLENGRLK